MLRTSQSLTQQLIGTWRRFYKSLVGVLQHRDGRPLVIEGEFHCQNKLINAVCGTMIDQYFSL